MWRGGTRIIAAAHSPICDGRSMDVVCKNHGLCLVFELVQTLANPVAGPKFGVPVEYVNIPKQGLITEALSKVVHKLVMRTVGRPKQLDAAVSIPDEISSPSNLGLDFGFGQFGEIQGCVGVVSDEMPFLAHPSEKFLPRTLLSDAPSARILYTALWIESSGVYSEIVVTGGSREHLDEFRFRLNRRGLIRWNQIDHAISANLLNHTLRPVARIEQINVQAF